VEINNLVGLKKQAEKEGWARFIRTAADEKALLAGYWYSWEAFDDFRRFTECINLIEGDWQNKPYQILDWHYDLCGNVFGWMNPNGYRRFLKAYVQIPKKNSKTTIAAIIALYMFVADGEGAPQVYCAASDSKQASLLWNISAAMIDHSPQLTDHLRHIKSSYRILKHAPSSETERFEAWSSDVTNKDGVNGSLVICDELHAWPASGRKFWDIIRYAGRGRKQPLCPFVITTPGSDLNSLCYEQYLYAKSIISGTITDDLFTFPLIYEANYDKIFPNPECPDEYDENYWKSRECLELANPGIADGIIDIDRLIAEAVEVENNPSAKAGFLRFTCGVWVRGGSVWLPAHVWNANGGKPFDLKSLENQVINGRVKKGPEACMGLDLSSVEDITSYAIVWAQIPKGESKYKYKVHSRSFVPEDTFNERVKKATAPLEAWREQGFIETTEGSAIDHDQIWEAMENDIKRFNVVEVGYDWNSSEWIVTRIQKTFPSIKLTPISQSYSGMGKPSMALKKVTKEYRLEHMDNPVLSWAVSNAIVVTRDGIERVHKDKSKDKIDPLIALICAFNQAHINELTPPKRVSIYSDPNWRDKIAEIRGETNIIDS
jgi:phage terminase large subunit-like protein